MSTDPVGILAAHLYRQYRAGAIATLTLPEEMQTAPKKWDDVASSTESNFRKAAAAVMDQMKHAERAHQKRMDALCECGHPYGKHTPSACRYHVLKGDLQQSCSCPGYVEANWVWEHRVMQGPRKSGWDDDMAPCGCVVDIDVDGMKCAHGWQLDPDVVGPDAWERFDFHEERYWRRKVQKAGWSGG